MSRLNGWLMCKVQPYALNALRRDCDGCYIQCRSCDRLADGADHGAGVLLLHRLSSRGHSVWLTDSSSAGRCRLIDIELDLLQGPLDELVACDLETPHVCLIK